MQLNCHAADFSQYQGFSGSTPSDSSEGAPPDLQSPTLSSIMPAAGRVPPGRNNKYHPIVYHDISLNRPNVFRHYYGKGLPLICEANRLTCVQK
ncbi:hypothetical protein [Dickeya dianthicola]|uniref:hypothetical protein n=1 Tax=Dickeya dianthicola TaxID=204039 RepID=UPI0018DEFDD0|nr:hypothetical protein [Dickeya dianthicola]